MSPQQIGHLMSDTEHSLQVTRCPHGTKTMSISLSKHILHSFSLWSFCSFSSGSSSEREELQTHRIIKALLIHSCCDSGTTGTFLHYTSRFTVWRAIKTVPYKDQEPGQSLFSTMLDPRACTIVCVSAPFLAAENPFWSELWKQAETFMTRI